MSDDASPPDGRESRGGGDPPPTGDDPEGGSDPDGVAGGDARRPAAGAGKVPREGAGESREDRLPRDPAGRSPRETVRFYLLDHRTLLGKAIDIGLMGLNVVFVAVFVAQTYPVAAETRTLLFDVEVAIALVFAVEYVLRIYGARSRAGEFLNGYTMVDLLAILPTFLLLVVPGFAAVADVGFLRALRVVRALRFYRFTKDAEFFFGTVSDNALRAMKLLLTVLVILFVSAGLFYSAEVGANPGVETFGDTFYYTVVALSTVGFGDIVPVTDLGRGVTVAAIVAGIILIPWQASKIVREWARRDKVDVTCPNCGLAAHDPDASHCKACGHVIYQEYESGE